MLHMQTRTVLIEQQAHMVPVVSARAMEMQKLIGTRGVGLMMKAERH